MARKKSVKTEKDEIKRDKKAYREETAREIT